MSNLPSTIHASTTKRLEHQFKNWETQPYVHPPEFEKVYEKLMRIDTDKRAPPREYHDDWKSL